MPIFTLFCAVLVFCILAWIISVFPVPANVPYVRNVLYVFLGIIAVIYLCQLAGCDPVGMMHRRV